MRKTIEQLKLLKESEDRIEFKKGEWGNVSYNGAGKDNPKDRRKCILGYVTALCNEGVGSLVIGMHDDFPHQVIGTKQSEGSIGDLESKIYRDTSIRTDVYELFEESKRVLVIDIPSRPTGKIFKYEDVALMRTGEDLRPMSDEVHLRILQEQEPDFSEQICQGLTIDDLDDRAIKVMKEKYADHSNNASFLTLSTEQVLSDMHLSTSKGVTNAALILLGKEEVIKLRLPQAAVRHEYRTFEHQIHFDKREEFVQPFFLLIDNLWKLIDLRNGIHPVREGAYISFGIPFFNEEVIREGVINAVAHREYRRQSETIIKQYPRKLEIISSGGFPVGVTMENILTVPSTPRNRLIADVLSKTGLVERSGQGIDKIYLNMISEGKRVPDYTMSDPFNVILSLSADVEDAAFALFIRNTQEAESEANKLSVFDVMALNSIRKSESIEKIQVQILESLKYRGLIHADIQKGGYTLNKVYYTISKSLNGKSHPIEIGNLNPSEIIQGYLKTNQKGRIGDFEKLLDGVLTKRQLKVLLDMLVDKEMLIREGANKGTSYLLK